MYSALLDRLLYRHPFEGSSADRYARHEQIAFGDLEERLLPTLDLARAVRFLDLGCGPGTLVDRARARYPHLGIVGIEPSRAFARKGIVRAVGEALPLPDLSIDVALCLSSIRHVRDREQTLRELRRVVRDRLVIVELDPDADRTRIAAHASKLGTAVLRHAFGPLVVKTAPPSELIWWLAKQAGFELRSLQPDPIQPVYVMELV